MPLKYETSCNRLCIVQCIQIKKVSSEKNEDSVGLEGMDDDKLEFVNAICFQKGRPPYRRGQFFNQPAGNAGPRINPSSAGTARRWGTCRRSASPDSVTTLLRWTPTGSPTPASAANRPALPVETQESTQSTRSRDTSPATRRLPSTPCRR